MTFTLRRSLKIAFYLIVWVSLLSCGLFIPPATVTPTVFSPTNTSTLTATLPPTDTPPPTLTVTPHPAQVFANPILSAIANRPPDYQDDFTSPSSGWDTGRQNEDVFIGTRTYVDGQYVMVADAANAEQMSRYGYGYVSGANRKLVSGLTDYVFEVEQTWISGSGWTMIFLCDADGSSYSVRLSRPGRAGGFWLSDRMRSPDAAVQFTNEMFFPFRATEQSKVRITFIIQGEQFAIFADGEPLYYSTLSGERKLGLHTIEFSLLTDSSVKPIEIHWDNLKVWDLNR